jgi:hypothetical protein
MQGKAKKKKAATHQVVGHSTGPRARTGSTGSVRNPRRGSTHQKVVLRLHSIECVKTTKEVDRDEMVLVGIATNVALRRGQAKAESAVRQKLALGKFKKGSKETYRKPKALASFAFGGDEAGWPRSYPAALLLIEKDEGKIGAIAAEVADAIDDKVADTLRQAAEAVAIGAGAAIAAGAAAGSVIPVVGTAAGAAVAAGVMAASSAIKKAKGDDVFPPRSVALDLRRSPDKKGEVAGGRETHVLSAHRGTYKLVTSWAVE